MTTPVRLTPLLLIACGALAAGHPAAASAEPKGEPVPFETVAVVSDISGINLGDHQILRLARNEDIDAVGELLAEDHGSPLADEVMAAVDEVPSGAVVLMGVIDVSCTPATEAGLVRLDAGGELVMFAPGHVPAPIECFAANTTVAVLAVDAEDAPPGSADGADLVEFAYAGVENPGNISAVELTDDPAALATILPADAEVPTLPASVAGVRRLGVRASRLPVRKC